MNTLDMMQALTYIKQAKNMPLAGTRSFIKQKERHDFSNNGTGLCGCRKGKKNLRQVNAYTFERKKVRY
ncbi:hypothetical protein KI811_18360 [Geobacter hydrogenophilus]|uniref:Uncharacterized protein n=1 Tax=Geobacter hydrogenophilus TaxID=40983 RepID=A0A9W6FY21_9BACT|nr:hypothetical protein [Geobacter hydrogenophilus]MBT0895766.1 hypothetical protein [Geobacter hydrogenophilus]GLI37129.1 hypothetical protein GHYDROH2_06300 [Geobacter hydrogenophilus]